MCVCCTPTPGLCDRWCHRCVVLRPICVRYSSFPVYPYTVPSFITVDSLFNHFSSNLDNFPSIYKHYFINLSPLKLIHPIPSQSILSFQSSSFSFLPSVLLSLYPATKLFTVHSAPQVSILPTPLLPHLLYCIPVINIFLTPTASPILTELPIHSLPTPTNPSSYLPRRHLPHNHSHFPCQLNTQP